LGSPVLRAWFQQYADYFSGIDDESIGIPVVILPYPVEIKTLALRCRGEIAVTH
jgi:hypothetical protein